MSETLPEPMSEEEMAAWKREMLDTQLRLQKLELAEKGSKVKVRHDTAARIEEANNLTRIGPLDRS